MKTTETVPYVLGSELRAGSKKHTVSFDGTAVTVTQAGLLRGKIGKHIKRIPVAQLTGVEIREPVGVGFGWVRFDTAGSYQGHKPFTVGPSALYMTWVENAAPVTKKTLPAFRGLVEAVNATLAIKAVRDGAPVLRGTNG